MQLTGLARFQQQIGRRVGSSRAAFIMAVVLLVLGFYLIYPVILILINTFNVAQDALVGPRVWGLGNWRTGFDDPRLLRSLGNTIMIWALTVGISFPVAVIISWILARTRIPFSHGLEFLFWVSYMMPGIATAVAWINLMDPDLGLLNKAVEFLPFVDRGPFNIFTVQGIVWTHLMANGVSIKVMLLTPAFRNMDSSLEEAARVSGSSNIRTMMRVTLPLLISPMVLVFALQMLRIFQSFLRVLNLNIRVRSTRRRP
jgi:iron(III) transport system permease protein